MKVKDKNGTTLSQYLAEEEIKGLKILLAAYVVFIFCAIGGFVGGKIMGFFVMEDWQFGIMVAGNVISSAYIVFTVYRKRYVFLAKYALFSVMAVIITLGMFWTGSSWVALGYYLLTVMAGFFYSWKISLFTGTICSLLLGLLTFFSPKFSPTETTIWLVYFIPVIVAMTFTNSRNLSFIKDIVKKNWEAEEAKSILEIRINARTKELKALSVGLEKQVSERTKELEGKIGELKRFNKLAVGRELKMISLKREILRMKKQFKKPEA